MKVLGNKLHVDPIRPTQQGSIHLTEALLMKRDLGKPRVWRVLGVGTKVTPEIEVGDRIITYSYTEGPTELPDGTWILTESQVMAVLPKTKIPTNGRENSP